MLQAALIVLTQTQQIQQRMLTDGLDPDQILLIQKSHFTFVSTSLLLCKENIEELE